MALQTYFLTKHIQVQLPNAIKHKKVHGWSAIVHFYYCYYFFYETIYIDYFYIA